MSPASDPSTAEIELSVSDFIVLLNQTLEFALGSVTIIGELANFRVSKNKWVYFDLKDEFSTLKFFGTIYNLPGPLEEGMLLRVKGIPRLHNLYGFSVNILSIQPYGQGSLKRSAELLKAKLSGEGLFSEERKRRLPYPPARIGLITAKQSAAYGDFIKILAARWRGLTINHIDVTVQGETAPVQIPLAIESLNSLADPPEVIVIIRGGGSSEDLAAFNTEAVTRAVAASRVPTLVAIGHEMDLSLAELAADRRASTPSNAAELLVPDSKHVLKDLNDKQRAIARYIDKQLVRNLAVIKESSRLLSDELANKIQFTKATLIRETRLLEALSPLAILRRGYAIVRVDGIVVKSVKKLKAGDIVRVDLSQGKFKGSITEIMPETTGSNDV